MSKRDRLYDNLISTGKVSANEIGTKEDFNKAIRDEKTARQFHDNLLTVFTEDEIGGADDFYNSISSDFYKPLDKKYSISKQHDENVNNQNYSQTSTPLRNNVGMMPSRTKQPETTTPLTKDDVDKMKFGKLIYENQIPDETVNPLKINPKEVTGKSVNSNDYASIAQRNPDALKNIILPPEAEEYLKNNQIQTGLKQDDPDAKGAPVPVYGNDPKLENKLRGYYASDPQGKKEYNQFLNKLDSYKYQLEDIEKRLIKREEEIKQQFNKETAERTNYAAENNGSISINPHELSTRIDAELGTQKRELRNAKNIIHFNSLWFD